MPTRRVLKRRREAVKTFLKGAVYPLGRGAGPLNSDRTRRGVFSVPDVPQSRSSCIRMFWADVLPRRGIDIRKLKEKQGVN